jgi:NodT family efflux transporter outer membrane factor (OMF) lipoprotein
MRTLICLVCLLALSACVATPPTTPQVQSVDTATLGLGPQNAPRAADAWWTVFQDPQVDRLAPLVIAGNPSLAAALARIRAAQAQLAVAQAADLPQANLEGQEQRELLSKDYVIPPPYAGSWRWVGNLQANFSWSIDFWGKQAALIAQAQSTGKAAALDAEAARLALAGAFAQTYLNLYLAWENGDIADRTVAERQEILTLTQNRFNAGLENQAALEQARALLSLAKIDQLRYAAQRDTDIHAIAALMGQGANIYPSITRPAPKLDTALPLPATLPADLLSRRPDVMAALARIDAAAKGREAAHADFYPNINLAAFAGFQAIGLGNLLSGNAVTAGAGPALHLPLFDAGRIRAQYAGATAALDTAIADYNGAVTGAVRQVSDAITQVQSLGAQRAQAQAALASAQKSYDLAESRYRSGLSTQLALLNAESTLLSARQQVAGIIANEAIERITLLLSVGGGFNPAASDPAADKEKP